MTHQTQGQPYLLVTPLKITKIAREADGISSFELIHPEGTDLPAFSAGAHIHVQIDANLSRQYSLCNDPAETHRYVIAVLRDDNGRGGSKAMHDTLREGQLVPVTGPDNHFPLAGREAKFHLLLAGGIGVTPMMAMIEELERAGKSYQLHYCTRSADKTAFLERLAARIADEKVVIHHDGGDPAKGLDIPGLITQYKIGTHVYACGPAGFMKAFNACLGAWPPHAVHQEYFAARELSEEEKAWDEKPFRIKVASTDALIDVPAGTSIVEALRANGIDIQTDCEEGYCGTCITRFIEGEPVHRDSVLDESDRETYVMACCARSKSELLVLDI